MRTARTHDMSDRAFSIRSAALMELKNATLLRFMYDNLIPRPKSRNKAAYASAIVDHFNRVKIDVELNGGALTIKVESWRR